MDAQRLIVNLEMIANAFSLIFARVNVHGEYGPMRSSTVIAHNSIISDALEYLKQNYLEDLRAADVAAYCHCSLSCLSHLFKSRVGTSLPLYIAKLRVDFARRRKGGLFRSELFFPDLHPVRRLYAQPVSQALFLKAA